MPRVLGTALSAVAVAGATSSDNRSNRFCRLFQAKASVLEIWQLKVDRWHFPGYLCTMSSEILNRVAQSGIEQIDLKDFLGKNDWRGIDLREQLWNDAVIREKEFREWISSHDWTAYHGNLVHLFCSADALIPSWAWMLVTSKLSASKGVFFGTLESAQKEFFFGNLAAWDVNYLKDKVVMVKGCSDIPDPDRAYVALTQKLQPVVKSLMFGEPCSAVPVYKRK